MDKMNKLNRICLLTMSSITYTHKNIFRELGKMRSVSMTDKDMSYDHLFKLSHMLSNEWSKKVQEDIDTFDAFVAPQRLLN